VSWGGEARPKHAYEMVLGGEDEVHCDAALGQGNADEVTTLSGLRHATAEARLTTE
jgi:hypothetical protein